jgi:hypothetical protein
MHKKRDGRAFSPFQLELIVMGALGLFWLGMSQRFSLRLTKFCIGPYRSLSASDRLARLPPPFGWSK